MDGSELDLTSYATDIVSAYVAHNAIGADKHFSGKNRDLKLPEHIPNLGVRSSNLLRCAI